MHDLTPAQIDLVRRTVAADCDPAKYDAVELQRMARAEFDLFMEACRQYRLDPFRKQIIPLVFSKMKADKRRMSIVVTRDGLRVIAQRCGDYRPASKPASMTYDADLKDPKTNPKGIVSCVVYLWKRDPSGEWYEVVGEVDWDEFAPLKEEWAPGSDGRRAPTGNMQLEGNWLKMPKVMITKCAEAQALRAGWPDQFSGLYVDEEMDRARAADVSASEMLELEAERIREQRINADKSILVAVDGATERWEIGQFYDQAQQLLGQKSDDEIYAWSVQNRESLKEFWARQPTDALALKKQIEVRTQSVVAA